MPKIPVLGYGTGERLPNSITEENFGDKIQNVFEATQALGNYVIQVEKFAIEGEQSKCYSWTAEVKVVDRLGVSRSNLDSFYLVGHAVFGGERRSSGDRNVIVASFSIEGKGNCK